MTKKPSAIKIGIFTVFLVVMVITMLKSVVDSAPILFVKIGQEEVGAIDFTLTSTLNSMNAVPTNLYNINPFVGFYAVPDEAYPPLPKPVNATQSNDDTSMECTTSTITGVNQTCPDHILFGDETASTSWIRSKFFEERLDNLEDFAGWFPRIYVPATTVKSAKTPDLTSHQTLAVIDTAKEIKVGVGYGWKPLVLAAN